jgi:hypothetical protein
MGLLPSAKQSLKEDSLALIATSKYSFSINTETVEE